MKTDYRLTDEPTESVPVVLTPEAVEECRAILAACSRRLSAIEIHQLEIAIGAADGELDGATIGALRTEFAAYAR